MVTSAPKQPFSQVECGSGKVPKVAPKLREEAAHKILDGPGAAKNFYYNLVDWGANNIVLLGLKESIYYWDASSCECEQLVWAYF